MKTQGTIRIHRLFQVGLLLAGLAACSQQSSGQTADPAQPEADGLTRPWTDTPGAALSGLALTPGSNSLSAQPWTAASNGWGPIEKDQSVGGNAAGDGKPLTLAGKTYAHGFGVHANSSMTFNLGAQCATFTSEIGVDDEVGDRGSVVFQVYGDGNKLYDSGVMTGASATKTLSVSVAGVKELKLVVTDSGNGNTNDHADWATPTLLNCTAATALPLRINTGGPAQTVNGVSWVGCTGLSTCGGYVTGGFAYGENRSISGAVAPANQTIYQTEWTGGSTTGIPAGGTAFAFRIPVPNGAYQVRLHFAELNKAAAGARVFDVQIEGSPALTGFDVYREAGGAQKAIVRTLDTTVSDGALTITFVRRVENAKISGIEILPATTPTGPLTWTERAPALQAVSEAQGAAVNGVLYVFGGFNKNLHTTARSQAYDAANNRWTSVHDMPEQITHGAVAVDGTAIYIAGGFIGTHPGPQTSHVWKYDTLTDTWSAAPPLPAARGAGAMVRLGRELHFFGGTERDLNNLDLYKRDAPEHWVLKLDGGTTWTTAAPMPNARNHMAGAVLNGLIYAIGGQHLGDEQAGEQADVQSYDPATNIWTTRASMPRPVGHINSSTLVWNGRIVVIAGVTLKSLEIANVIEYDPASNAWTELTPIPAARQSPIADLIGSQVVVTTGSLPSGVFTTTWTGGR
ncbi:NPCBM/NEW2 domain-containing protein (plasmid) [Deinococcus sp. KNUC1210]|uniref:NPCBM/NEW2 domain-containing protein n=1 Tax=Deinococcus sp. KNUC1210 TaxID=2917691 RepID=UPI001EF078FC|nr:NPCBM/NEW2 domain-containing protein [Deinococcus sp. KNUC1210]ULH17590.1 NPCBM/NEW2 domain-containing protein [Deinococcus sp. KNUC1210]